MKQQKINIKGLFAHWETFLILIFLGVNIINIQMSPYYLNYNNLMNSMINFMDQRTYGIWNHDGSDTGRN